MNKLVNNSKRNFVLSTSILLCAMTLYGSIYLILECQGKHIYQYTCTFVFRK